MQCIFKLCTSSRSKSLPEIKVTSIFTERIWTQLKYFGEETVANIRNWFYDRQRKKNIFPLHRIDDRMMYAEIFSAEKDLAAFVVNAKHKDHIRLEIKSLSVSMKSFNYEEISLSNNCANP